MKRRWFRVFLHVFAGLSLTMCVVMATAFSLGGWYQAQIHHLIGRWWYNCAARASVDNQLQIVIIRYWPTPVIGPRGNNPAAADAWIAPLQKIRMESDGFAFRYGAELASGSTGNWAAIGTRLGLAMPFWAAAAIWLIPPAFVWLIPPFRRHRAKSIGAAENPIEPSVVVHDLPCVHCGYNLRTLHSTAACPECGSLVADSLEPNAELVRTRPAWLRCLAAGSVLLFLSRLFLAATFSAVFKRNGGFVEEYVTAIWCAGAFITLYFAGNFLLTMNEYPHSADRKSARGLRKLTIASLICFGACVCYQAVRTSTTPKPFGLMNSPSVEWYWPTIILLLAGWVLHCWCVVDEFLFLAKLASRLPDRFMARICTIGGFGAAVSGLLLIYAARSIVNQWEELGALWGIVTLWFGLLLWTGLANLDLAIRFYQQARWATKRLSIGNLQVDDADGMGA